VPVARKRKGEDEAAERAFGAENRARLIDQWFDEHGAEHETIDEFWEAVYRLLLWIDPTIGLAHCYESDKSQPGRAWYARSLAFHVWLSDRLGVRPVDLGDEIDWLFRRAIRDLAAQQRAELSEKAREQRAPYLEYDLPEPGEDPELAEIIKEELAEWLREPPPDEVWRRIVTRVQAYLSEENKRRNLTGEGFEDVVAALVNRLPSASDLSARTRVRLDDVRGFYPTRVGEKPKVVDLVIEGARTGYRTLVTAKWSVRSDREEQFKSDFEAYARLQSVTEGFGHALITNEFDPARLVRACESRVANAPLFTHVVHVNPEGVLAAYGAGRHKTQRKVREYVESERLIGLGDWLRLLLDHEAGA
jgi:hypothetical protein